MNDEYQFNIDEDSQQRSSFGRINDSLWGRSRKLRIVACIIFVTVAAVYLLSAFKPEAQKRAIPETVVRVDVIEASISDYPIVVNANGTIEAETRGNLVAQIRGEIVSMSDNFKTGGSFQKGDVLIEIDPRDYQAARSQALASLSQADAAYRQEKANAKQAKEDWMRLGNTESAPDLVLRKPQLAAANAMRDSASAAYETAQLNLSRTKITAPYSGRIISRDAVLGQYVGIGTPIAEVFSTDGVEVRLPISQDEFNQLGLDQFDPENTQASPFNVVLSSQVGNRNYQWTATVTRTDSTFNVNTRQIDVIAEVQDPFGTETSQPSLKIGQFVSARIQGRTVENVFVIPNKSIREGSYTYVAREGRLAKQNITIAWQDDENTLIDSGISAGDLVVTTSLNSTLAGAKAKLPDSFGAAREQLASPDSESSETDFNRGEQATSDAEGVSSDAAEAVISEEAQAVISEDAQAVNSEEAQAVYKDQVPQDASLMESSGESSGEASGLDQSLPSTEAMIDSETTNAPASQVDSQTNAAIQ